MGRATVVTRIALANLAVDNPLAALDKDRMRDDRHAS
ncbi:UNVERIFIED_ORG: hypothetical protein J2Y81_007942 [Paraburkholderia sediminicola]|nr:hypothetical protein [Paraburkholderia sediminicola]